MQPADVGWFKELKLFYKQDWSEWFLKGEKTVTRFGNLAGPGYQNMSKWLLRGWEQFENEKIVNSFSYCGITSNKEYHSQLTDLLKLTLLPPQKTVEPREPHEDINLNHLFINVDYQDYDHTILKSNKDETQTESRNQSDNGDQFFAEMNNVSDDENWSSKSGDSSSDSSSDESLISLDQQNNSLSSLDFCESEESTDENSDSPSVSSKSPSVFSKSPSVSSKSPSVSSKSPSVSSKLTSVSSKSPKVSSKYPSVSSKSPSVSIVSQRVSSKSPRVSTKSPFVSSKSTSVASSSKRLPESFNSRTKTSLNTNVLKEKNDRGI